ncbi:peptidyl-prolyl cis-trans isomerase [Cerasicoccus arenae]|uniref:PpiC domain-containing protein n=1 Tax=Cerasicoccus arenae TaxID=424488 RepID=A0A8J3DH26_9BACT|nr:peptidyl-prolyl cis-trans isomerase [Cerasicoccus arenae]MBK1859161.1 peptidyl-prolyl cis-trans isomerase [Cerasicoccus arenae]GHB98204.1 hypothetical protein GCM10007047_12780 [Cerasicoccus arenae]
MFTWLQTHIQRHHKIIFGVILVVIIISFVFTIGNFGGFGNPTNQNNGPREFYGFNLNSNRDRTALEQWTLITLALNRQRTSDEAIQYGAMQRAVMLYLANELQIPEPTQQQFQEYVRECMAFKDFRTGEFSQDMYTRFIDGFKNNPNMNEDTLVIALSQNFRMEQVGNAIGGPGYVMPYLAVEEIKRRDSVWSVDLATLERSTFKPEINITDEALDTYYQQNKFRYETKPQFLTEFVSFSGADFLDQVGEPTEADILKFYNSQRAQWPKNEEGATKPLDEIKDEVIAKWKAKQAQQIAIDEANKLAVALYDATYEGKVKQGDESLATFISDLGLTLAPLPAFSSDNLPGNTPIPPAALQQALSLDEKRFYSDGLVTADGGAIIFLKEKSGTTIPPLAEVRAQVVADYSKEEEQRQFNQKGQSLQKELQAAVKEDKNFAETADSLGLVVESYADFTMAAPPEGLDNFELSTINDMSQGEVSNMVGFGDIGTVIYVKKLEVPEVTAESPDVVAEMSQLTGRIAQATESSILNELIAIGSQKLEATEEAL